MPPTLVERGLNLLCYHCLSLIKNSTRSLQHKWLLESHAGREIKISILPGLYHDNKVWHPQRCPASGLHPNAQTSRSIRQITRTSRIFYIAAYSFTSTLPTIGKGVLYCGHYVAVCSRAVTKVLAYCSTNILATHYVYKDVLVPLSPEKLVTQYRKFTRLTNALQYISG